MSDSPPVQASQATAPNTPSIRYCRGKDIDRGAWDACVQACGSVPYAFSWYLDLVAEGRWDALVMDAKGAKPAYRAVFPLPWKRKLGIKVVYTPFFVQQLGLFALPGEPDALPSSLPDNGSSVPPLSAWLEAIPKGFRKVHLQGQAIDGLDAPDAARLPKTWKQSERLNLLLPLGLGPEALKRIREGYSSNLKRNLNKARKSDVEPVEALDAAAFVAQFRLEQGPQITELGDADYGRMERILAEGMARKAFYALEIRPAHAQGSSNLPAPLARLCFWKGPRGPLFLYGSSTELGRKSGAMALGFDHAIGHFCGVTNDGLEGAKGPSPEGGNKPYFLDFEGSTREGLARFYRSFGAVEERYAVWEKRLSVGL